MAFSHCLTIGPVRFAHLRKKYGSAKEAYFARGVELVRLIGAGPASRFCSFRRNFDPEKTARLILEKGIKVLCTQSREYPVPLLHIDDPPICLYAKGSFQNGPVPAVSVAIVGSRKPTPYGLLVANRFAAELGERGITVVSGMAAGIDTAAHRGRSVRRLYGRRARMRYRCHITRIKRFAITAKSPVGAHPFGSIRREPVRAGIFLSCATAYIRSVIGCYCG
jgi:predicted Rossmann fold nucleotide-binding protein DprA/Smf involved in DNA uptake